MIAKSDHLVKASFEVRHASASAVAQIEKLGGSVTLLQPANQAHIDAAKAKSAARAKAKGPVRKSARVEAESLIGRDGRPS